MRTCAGMGVCLCLLGLSSSADAAPPPKGNPAPPSSKVDADVLPPGQFVGTIVSAPNSDRMLTLRITSPELRLKPGARNPQVVPVAREVRFQVDANVKVRIKDLPEQFDDKGNIKKHTAAELSALKGKDKNLIGYESSVEALQPGQIVMLSLRSHKKTNATMPETPPSRKDKATEPATEHKMQVTMIVILKDGDAPQNSPPPAKPNKK